MAKRTIFTSCIRAKELALTPVGSNPGAHALVTRSAPDAAQESNPSENIDMDAKDVARLIATSASWDDVTRSHYAGLNEDAQVAFLARTPDEQKTEATEAKRVTDEAATAEAARAAGVTAGELALQRRFDEQAAEIAALKAKDAERNLMDVARGAEFIGYPGGEDKVVEQLRAIATLPVETQKVIRDGLALAASTARGAAQVFGHSNVSDVTRSESEAASKRIDEAATALAAKRNIPHDDAWLKVIEDPAFATDVALVNSVQ